MPIALSPHFRLRADQGAIQGRILDLTLCFDDAFRDIAVCDLTLRSNGSVGSNHRVPYFGGWMDKRGRNDFHIIICFIDSLVGLALVEQYLLCIQRLFNITRVDPGTNHIRPHLRTMLDHK